MNSKIIFIALLALVCWTSCKKKDDLYGDGFFAGKLMSVNEHTGDQQLAPLAGKRVYVAYFPSDTLNYIYSAITNSEGYFRFTNMDKQKSYTLFFTDSIGGLKYEAAVTDQPNSDKILLIATPDMQVQNGLNMLVADAMGSRIQGATVYVYSNYDIYKADSAAKDNKAALDKFVTNQYGVQNWFNIAPAHYYLIAKKEEGVALLGYGQATVAQTGMTKAEIKLTGPDAYAKNGLSITVQDRDNNAMQANVYIYDNYTSYRTDSIDNKTTGAMHTLPVNGYGKASWLNVVPRKYYMIAKKEAGSVTLVGYGNETVGATGITPASIHVAEPDAYAVNALLLRVEDTWGNRIQGATIYLYDSYDLYRADSAGNSITGAIRNTNTSQTGTAQWLNLPAGKYYLMAVKEQSGLRLTGHGSATVNATGVTDASPLKLVPPAAKPMVSITVHDALNTPLSGADIYLYTSQQAAQLDVNYTAFTHHLTSDLTGVASQQSIPAGFYYIKGVKTINSTTLTGTSTIPVSSTSTSAALIKLQ